MGCDVYASDLNPIACMLTWGAFNIIGASHREARRDRSERRRRSRRRSTPRSPGSASSTTQHGNRAKAYLYCLETRCPKTGWMVPMAPSWVISKTRNVVAKLVPDHAAKRYAIEVHTGVSAAEMAEAEQGTVRDGRLVHPMNPERSGVEIKTIRGDYRDADGINRNRLRLWEKSDFVPRPDDIFQERLYCDPVDHQGQLGQGPAGDLLRRRHRRRSRSRAAGRGDCSRESCALAGRGPRARHADRAGRQDRRADPDARLDALASFVWRAAASDSCRILGKAVDVENAERRSYLLVNSSWTISRSFVDGRAGSARIGASPTMSSNMFSTIKR